MELLAGFRKEVKDQSRLGFDDNAANNCSDCRDKIKDESWIRLSRPFHPGRDFV